MPRWLQKSVMGLYALIFLCALLPSCAPTGNQDEQGDLAIEQWDNEEKLLPPMPMKPLDEQLVGFAIGIHHTYDETTFYPSIDRIHALGGNAIEIITPAYQEHGASVQISRPRDKTPTTRQLENVIRYARSKGMHVSLMPIVLFANPRGNEWRGKINPRSWTAWWESYKQQMLHFARLAQNSGVDTFSVGSELLSTEKQADNWADLIASIRKVYKGKLIYSTNWDHYHVLVFWEQLDLIGINGYWELSKDRNASHAALTKRWQEIRGRVTSFAKRKNRPFVFTEVGYPSLPWGVKDPWNYIASNNEQSDELQQLKGYRAFTAAWEDLIGKDRPGIKRNQVAGVYFYEWTNTDRGGPEDTGYSIYNKKTHGFLKEWMKRHRQPASVR